MAPTDLPSVGSLVGTEELRRKLAHIISRVEINARNSTATPGKHQSADDLLAFLAAATAKLTPLKVAP